MKVIIDGKEVPVLTSAKIIWDGETLPIDGVFFGGVELHLTANPEGIVLDIMNPESGEVEATAYQFVPDLADICNVLA